MVADRAVQHDPLGEALKSAAQKMRADFAHATRSIEHRGSKGRAREGLIVAEYLGKYAPRRLDVAHGAELVATDGQVSAECDVVLYDRDCPPLWSSDNYRILPIETAMLMMEVKSTLDMRELEDAVQKIQRAKRMPKRAFEAQSGDVRYDYNVYGRTWEYFPLAGLIFAFESIDPERLMARLVDLENGLDAHLRVDGVHILSRGSVMPWMPDDQANPLRTRPDPGTALVQIESDDPLFMMTVQLDALVGGASARRFRLRDYVPQPWGSVAADRTRPS